MILTPYILFPLLAVEALPDPQQYPSIGWVCVIGAAIIAALNQGYDLVGHMRGKPPAGELQLSTTQLGERVSQLEENYQQMSKQLTATRETLIDDADERRRAIYSKIDELRRETKEDFQELRTEVNGELRGYNARNEQRAEAVHNRINEILAAVSELRGEAGRK